MSTDTNNPAEVEKRLWAEIEKAHIGMLGIVDEHEPARRARRSRHHRHAESLQHRERPRDRGMHQGAHHALRRRPPHERAEEVLRGPPRQPVHERREGPAEQQQRRRHHRQQQVLRHVRTEQPRTHRVQRRPERGSQRHEPAHEARGSSHAPPPRLDASQPSPAAQVRRRRDRHRHDRGARRAPRRPHAGGRRHVHSLAGGTATGARSGLEARSSAPGMRAGG